MSVPSFTTERNAASSHPPNPSTPSSAPSLRYPDPTSRYQTDAMVADQHRTSCAFPLALRHPPCTCGPHALYNRRSERVNSDPSHPSAGSTSRCSQGDHSHIWRMRGRLRGRKCSCGVLQSHSMVNDMYIYESTSIGVLRTSSSMSNVPEYRLLRGSNPSASHA
jgi:hypothetical protein